MCMTVTSIILKHWEENLVVYVKKENKYHAVIWTDDSPSLSNDDQVSELINLSTPTPLHFSIITWIMQCNVSYLLLSSQPSVTCFAWHLHHLFFLFFLPPCFLCSFILLLFLPSFFFFFFFFWFVYCTRLPLMSVSLFPNKVWAAISQSAPWALPIKWNFVHMSIKSHQNWAPHLEFLSPSPPPFNSLVMPGICSFFVLPLSLHVYFSHL